METVRAIPHRGLPHCHGAQVRRLPSGHPTLAACQTKSPRPILIQLSLGWLFLVLTLLIGVAACEAQEDFYPLPARNPGGFGFPYPPPAVDEPGVSFSRRYMLDGEPELGFALRPQDEVWLISSREIESLDDFKSTDQFVCKYAVGTSWNQVPLENLIQAQRSDPSKETVVFIHGNRTPAYWSRRRGKQAYQVLFGNEPDEMPPVRFIIWSWPSDPLPQPIQDFQAKMDRAVMDGILFGQVLSMLSQRTPLNLVTYSLGTQIAFSAVETVAAETGSCPPIKMIAMAPVTHCRWPLSRWQLQTTADHIQCLRFFRNQDDIAIKAYKAFCTLKCKKCFQAGADLIQQIHPNASQVQVDDSVGKEHNILGYVSQPRVGQQLRSFLDRHVVDSAEDGMR